MDFIKVFLFLSLLLNHYLLNAQQTEKHYVNKSERIVPEEFNTILFSIDYASNTNVLGNFNLETKQPSFSPSLVFFSRYNFDVSVLGYLTGNSDDSLEHYTSELDFIAGYLFKPFDNLSVYPCFAHFFHSRNSNSLKSIFSNDFRVDMEYNYRLIDLGVSAGYFFGNRHTFYASAYNYYKLNFDHAFFRSCQLIIQPGIDAYFSSYEYLNLFYLDQIRNNPDFYNYLRNYSREKLRNPRLTYSEILDNYFEEKAEDNFKLTAFSVNLPFYYTIKSFVINLGLYLFIPVNQPDYLIDDPLFFFDIGLSYCLNLSK
jgi:hypothetical protein